MFWFRHVVALFGCVALIWPDAVRAADTVAGQAVFRPNVASVTHHWRARTWWDRACSALSDARAVRSKDFTIPKPTNRPI